MRCFLNIFGNSANIVGEYNIIVNIDLCGWLRILDLKLMFLRGWLIILGRVEWVGLCLVKVKLN